MADRYTWRRDKGRRWYGIVSYSLRINGIEPKPWVAKIQSAKGGMWFWYGSGMNSASAPTTLEECKRDAVAHIKALREHSKPSHSDACRINGCETGELCGKSATPHRVTIPNVRVLRHEERCPRCKSTAHSACF